MDQKYNIDTYISVEICYKDFVQYSKSTGVEKKDASEFYDQLHALFDKKRTVHPVSLGDSLDSLHSNTEPVMPLSDDSQINIATSTVTSPSLSSGSLGRDYRCHSSFSRGSVESCCSESPSCSSVSESDFSSPPAKPPKKKKTEAV